MSDTSFIRGLRDRIAELEKENRELKEEKEFFYKSAKQFREENEKLKKENEYLKFGWVEDFYSK